MNQKLDSLGTAVAYLRVDSSGMASHHALQRQREVCQQVADKHGLRLAAEYVDRGCPAQLEEQPALRRLLSDATDDRSISAVVLYDLARLAGSLLQLERVQAHLKVCGIELLTVTGVEVAERFVQSQRMAEAFRRLPKPGGAR